MPNLSAWASPTNAQSATSIGDLITRKPTTITIIRAGSAIASQVVRLETLSSQRAVVGEGGVTFMCDAHLLGYRNHPTVSDTSVKAGDRFRAGSVDYEIVIVLPGHVDNVQCYLRVRA
jgi:hypothetical protein